MNQELTDVQAGFLKGRGTRDHIANICWIIKKLREFQKKHLLLLYWLCTRLCVAHNKLWKILQEMWMSDHLTCLLRNLNAGQETTVRTRHGRADCFHLEKGIHLGCILLPCLFNLYAEDIMQNWKMKEAQAGIKIAGKNISNLRYTILMAES